MGRGLVNGTFRIEYKNATGTVAVEGKDFGQTTPLSVPVVDASGVADGLLESNVQICRTPHYLAVCTDDVDDGAWTGTCPTYCEYFPDFKSDDASAPIDKHGNYTVPCGKYDVNTFNGTNSADDPETVTDVEAQRVNAVVFEDKCDADSFLLLNGQIVNIQGDLSGPLEVECQNLCEAYDDSDDNVVFEFYLDPEDPWKVWSVTYAELETLHGDGEAEFETQWRFVVYSKHGNGEICQEPCEGSTEPRNCLSKSRVDMVDPQAVNAVDDPAVFFEEFYYGVGGEDITVTLNDYVNTGLGDDTVTGGAGYNIIEDHGGDDTITGGAKDDLVISRDGGEIITLLGDANASINTVRVYPTHEKDHLFGWKDPEDTRQCTKIIDVWEETTIELVMDDQWYPDHKFTNEDDFCAVMVHGWELEWYWSDLTDGSAGWTADAGTNKVDIWYSRSNGQADLCLSSSETECEGPDSASILAPFCITYWVKCDPKPVSVASTVEEDLLADAWSSWFGW